MPVGVGLGAGAGAPLVGGGEVRRGVVIGNGKVGDKSKRDVLSRRNDTENAEMDVEKGGESRSWIRPEVAA